MPGGKIDPERPFIPLGNRGPDDLRFAGRQQRHVGRSAGRAHRHGRPPSAGARLGARRQGGDSSAKRRRWIDDPAVDVIVTTGGTGLTGRDVTPEAFRELFDKELEGFTVLWHLVSYETVGVSTMQSRACAGIAGNTVIYVLPGSNGACRDGWDQLISRQLDSRHRPCSIVEVMPRFQENV